MPTLQTNKKPVKVFLPSTNDCDNDEKAWVLLDINPARASELAMIDANDTSGTIGLKTLAARIKEWNFTDDTKAPVPINFDTVGLLDLNDYRFLNRTIDEFSDIAPPTGLNNSEKKV